MTWADISVVHESAWIGSLGLKNPIDEKTPKLKALVQKVESQPKIVAWMKKRPPTPPPLF